MKVKRPIFAIRVDASIEIGTGHLIRCITLAQALTELGATCFFICRNLADKLLFMVNQSGHQCHNLSTSELGQHDTADLYAKWLGTTQEQDATECRSVLTRLSPDCLIVDHYSIDEKWERIVRPVVKKIMVIDDLANRTHDCDLLLDQTLGRKKKDYYGLVPFGTNLLTGAHYALLKPEFRLYRDASLYRRQNFQIKHVMVSLGGIDRGNATSKILEALAEAPLPENCKITVVLGPTAPWTEIIRERVAKMPFWTELKVGVQDMAALLKKVDIVIGAPGTSAWERCSLGVPALLVVLAENQSSIARKLEECGAVKLLSLKKLELKKGIFDFFDSDSLSDELEQMALASASVLDGDGTRRVSSALMPSPLYSIRFASLDDAKRIFEWRYVFSGAGFYRNVVVPTYEEHLNWLKSALRDEACSLLMVMKSNVAIAHVRFDNFSENPDKKNISISLSPEVKNKGYSAEILYSAITNLERPLSSQFFAEVHKDHVTSKRLFFSLGFKKIGADKDFLRLFLTADDLKKPPRLKFLNLDYEHGQRA